MKKRILLLLVFIFSFSINSTVFSQSIDTLSTVISSPSCNGGYDGSVNVFINQTSPLTYVEVQLLWMNPSSGFWVTLGNSNGTGSQFPFPSLGAGDYRIILNDYSILFPIFIEDFLFTINEPLPVVISTISVVNPTTVVSNNGSIDISVSGGSGIGPVPNYFFQWSNGATTEDLANLGVGTYSLLVTDVNGCDDTASFNLTANTPCGYSNYSSTDVVCSGGNTGSIHIDGVFGLGAQSYSLEIADSLGAWQFYTSVNTLDTFYTFNNLQEGIYRFTVQDPSCSQISPPIQISGPSPINVATIVTDATSASACDGLIQAVVNGGVAPYNYLWCGGQSTNAVLGMCSGVCCLVVTDANGCVVNHCDSVEVAQPCLVPIQMTVSSENESCKGDDGSIQININSGVPPFYASTDGGLNFDTIGFNSNLLIDSLSAANYGLVVKDDSACVLNYGLLQISADSVPNIDMATQATDIICNGDTNGTFKVLYPDDDYDYVLWRYTLFSPQVAVDTGSYFNELIKGYYGVVATSSSGACVDSSSIHFIDEPAPVVFDTPLTSAIFCMNNGVCNGDISLDGLPTGGISPYQFSINETYTNVPSAVIDSDSIFEQLCPGEYEVSVFDANACVVKDTVILVDSSLYIDSIVIKNNTCYSSDDGMLSVYAHGGLGSYSYLWSNLDTMQVADSLLAGNYNVVVTDSASCFASISANVTQPDTLLFKIIESGKIPESCMGVSYDGQIFLEITGGTPPYNYSWVGNSGVSGFGVGDTMTALTYDTITISVSDVNSCLSSPSWGTINMTIVDALNASTPLLIDTVIVGNSPMCYGAAVGSLQIDVAQGVIPYQYSIDNGNTQYLSSGFSNLIAQSYNVVVYDAFGCTDSSKVLIEEYSEMLVEVDSIKHVSCFDGDDGLIQVSNSGGEGQCTFLWSPTLETTNIITSLSAMSYSVVIEDSLGCVVADTIVLEHLTDPIQSYDLQVSATTCHGGDDGEATIQIAGGMPYVNGEYDVNWIDGLGNIVETGNVVSNMLAGLYIVEVSDSFSCGPFVDTVVVPEPEQFYLDIANIDHNKCYGESNGKIWVNAFGGTSPYSNYQIMDSLGSVLSFSSNIYSALTANSYSLWAIDSHGCNSDTMLGVKLGQPGKIIPESQITDLSCFASDDGEIDLLLLSGTPPYSYNLIYESTIIESANVLQNQLVKIYDLSFGDYILKVKDYNNCEVDTQITVGQPDEIVADFMVDDDMGRESFRTSFSNYSLGADDFIWNFGDGNSASKGLQDDVVHTFTNQGQYEVMLIAQNTALSQACNDTAYALVDVEGYDIFNSFSPNNDGINDVFKFDEWMMSGIDVEVYNRWGQKVYHWSGLNESWNGKGYNGEELPEGVYFYYMKATGVDGYSFEEEGAVSLFR